MWCALHADEGCGVHLQMCLKVLELSKTSKSGMILIWVGGTDNTTGNIVAIVTQ